MVLPRRDASSPVALWALLAANAVPLVGVLWWGWNPFDVLALYWLESGIIGALNVPKILLAEGDDDPGFALTINGVPVDPGATGPRARASLAGFFVMHYGIFWVVHGVFVLFGLPLFAGGGGVSASPWAIALGAGSLLASHGASFAANYLDHGEYRRVAPAAQMMRPYGRVVVLHLVVVLGAFVVTAVGSPTALLVLLVVLKTVLDLGAHLREHARVRPGEPVAPAGRSE